VTVLAVVVGVPQRSLADGAEFKPPFIHQWVAPGGPQIASYNITKNELRYAGDSIGALNLKTGKLLWKRQGDSQTPDAGAFEGAKLYGEIQDYGIIADNAATGRRIWTLRVPLPINNSVMCVDNRKLFVELRTGYITALRASDHKVIWKVPLAPKGSKTKLNIDKIMAVGHQKLLVVASTLDFLHGAYTILCLSPSSGSVLWRMPVIPSIVSGIDRPLACVADAKNMYVEDANRDMKAFSLRDGTIEWRQSNTGFAPTIGGTQIVSLWNGRLIAFNSATGRKLWSVTLSKDTSEPWAAPTMRGSEIWVVGEDYLYCVASSGKLRWKWPVQADLEAAPIFVRDGFLLSVDGSLIKFHHGTPQGHAHEYTRSL